MKVTELPMQPTLAEKMETFLRNEIARETKIINDAKARQVVFQSVLYEFEALVANEKKHVVKYSDVPRNEVG